MGTILELTEGWVWLLHPQTRALSHTHMYTPINTHAPCTHAHILANTCTHISMHTQSRAHAHTCTLTHWHTHAHIQAQADSTNGNEQPLPEWVPSRQKPTDFCSQVYFCPFYRLFFLLDVWNMKLLNYSKLDIGLLMEFDCFWVNSTLLSFGFLH